MVECLTWFEGKRADFEDHVYRSRLELLTELFYWNTRFDIAITIITLEIRDNSKVLRRIYGWSKSSTNRKRGITIRHVRSILETGKRTIEDISTEGLFVSGLTDMSEYQRIQNIRRDATEGLNRCIEELSVVYRTNRITDISSV